MLLLFSWLRRLANALQENPQSWHSALTFWIVIKQQDTPAGRQGDPSSGTARQRSARDLPPEHPGGCRIQTTIRGEGKSRTCAGRSTGEQPYNTLPGAGCHLPGGQFAPGRPSSLQPRQPASRSCRAPDTRHRSPAGSGECRSAARPVRPTPSGNQNRAASHSSAPGYRPRGWAA